MIRYADASLREIQAWVEQNRPDWKAKATERKRLFNRARAYTTQLKDCWRDVIEIYIQIQYDKCAYCETRLQYKKGDEKKKGAVRAWDLEHFRPKGRVSVWPIQEGLYDFPTGDATATGYYKLAYHLGNYVATCKRCNEDFKKDYFPIAADRLPLAATPEACTLEQAFLIYPLGKRAENPEGHITFTGVTAEPLNGSQRGRVMIDLLSLNREDLQAARAFWLLYSVWPALLLARTVGGEHKKDFAYHESQMAEHTNCTRHFVRLYDTDPAAAKKMLESFKIIISLHFKDRPGKRL